MKVQILQTATPINNNEICKTVNPILERLTFKRYIMVNLKHIGCLTYETCFILMA